MYIDPIDLAISELLMGKFKKSAFTYETLEKETGIGHRTLKRTFLKERAATMGELRLLALALGTTVSDIAAEAEGLVQDV